MKQTKDELRIRVLDLEAMIIEFSVEHDIASSEWKAQEHIKPLMEEGQRLIDDFREQSND